VGAGLPSAGDVNRQVDLANLAFASDIPGFQTQHETMGDVRREISPTLAVELRAGYWWKRRGTGLYTRRISAIPIELGAVYSPLSSRRARAGVTAAGGILYQAKMTGEDPDGGVDFSGTGVLAEAGIAAELAISPAWALQGRTVARYARAGNVFPDGGDIDLSGIAGTVGLRVTFAPPSSRKPPP
jgi:hypothetical protein